MECLVGAGKCDVWLQIGRAIFHKVLWWTFHGPLWRAGVEWKFWRGVKSLSALKRTTPFLAIRILGSLVKRNLKVRVYFSKRFESLWFSRSHFSWCWTHWPSLPPSTSPRWFLVQTSHEHASCRMAVVWIVFPPTIPILRPQTPRWLNLEIELLGGN